MKDFEYIGNDIAIEETPQGCRIYSIQDAGHPISVESPEDAKAIIHSLKEMLHIQFGVTDE